MSGYDTNNRGTMGRNKRRESDKHPEFTGKAMVDGANYWVSGWVREKDGEKFFSLSFKPMQERAPQPIAQPKKPAGNWADQIDDDLPF